MNRLQSRPMNHHRTSLLMSLLMNRPTNLRLIGHRKTLHLTRRRKILPTNRLMNHPNCHQKSHLTGRQTDHLKNRLMNHLKNRRTRHPTRRLKIHR